jgi:hypothetical protein
MRFYGAEYSLFGDSENREKNYLKIRDLLSIALFNILGTHYLRPFFCYIVWVLLNQRVTVISFIDFARECNMICYCTEIAF